MEKLPVLVIEYCELSFDEIIKRAEDNVDSSLLSDIRCKKICPHRWNTANAVIYLIWPSRYQVYLARELSHAHYQLNCEDAEKVKALCANTRKPNGTRIVEIVSSASKYEDEFLSVINYQDALGLSPLDRDSVEYQLKGRAVDLSRNNVCVDLGFAGFRNCARDIEYMGLTRPNEHNSTREEWAKRAFVAMTKILDHTFPCLKGKIYNDEERNSFLSGQICEGNKAEAMRFHGTNNTDILLDIHSDKQNCNSLGYGWVCTASWVKDDFRYGVTTYGKKCAGMFIEAYRRHNKPLRLLRRVLEALPEHQKKTDASIFPGPGVERIAYDYAFLDKGVFYSLFATQIQKLCYAHESVRCNLYMVCALLANVVMSESPDHFWRICDEMMISSQRIAMFGQDIFIGDPYDAGFAISNEIFKRKKHNGCSAEKIVSYPVHNRHPPAVNKRPTREQIVRSINAIALGICQIQALQDVTWNLANALHYYGRLVEYLVEESYGAGHLTAMHIVGVAACLQLLPSCFLEVGEMGMSTKTFHFFRWLCNYSTNPPEACKQTTEMMRAACVSCGMNMKQVEELCCQTHKHIAPPANSICYGSPCYMDVDTVPFKKKAPRGTGDVVYSTMKHFKVVGCDVYELDATGKLVLSASLFELQRICSGDDKDSIWKRRPASGRSFHYRRPSTSRKLIDISQYFHGLSPKGVSWTPKSEFGAEAIGRHIMGPDPETVLFQPESRQPLDLKQLLYEAMGGIGRFVKGRLFQCDVQKFWLANDQDCTSKIGKKNFHFYSVGVKLHDGSIHWPNPLFGMYATGTDIGLNNLPWDCSRTENIGYFPWNFSRMAMKQGTDRTVRWFRDRTDATNYALFEFFFSHLELFDIEHRQIQSLLFLGTRRKRDAFDDGQRICRVFFDPKSQHSRRDKTPFVIAVKHDLGGVAYYFCNSFGSRCSGVHLKPPMHRTTRLDRPGTMYELVAVISHRSASDRKVIFKGSTLNLVVKWRTSEVTEEPFGAIFEDCPREVLKCARKNDLLHEKGWSKVRRLAEAENAGDSSTEPHLDNQPNVEQQPLALRRSTRTEKNRKARNDHSNVCAGGVKRKRGRSASNKRVRFSDRVTHFD